MRLYTSGTIVRQFEYWSIGSFLHPYESHLPIATVLKTRIIAALSFLTSLGYHKGESDRKLLCWEIDFVSETHLQFSKFVSKSLHVKWRERLTQDQRKCAVYNNRSINLLPPKADIIVVFISRRRRPVCTRVACLVLTTQYTVQWVHTSPVITQKLYFETGIPQILLISERGRRSNIAFITKILQICCRKKWNGNICFHRNLYQREKAKRVPKGQTNFLRPTNLRLGQKKPVGQLIFLGQPTWKKAYFFNLA